LKKNLPSEAEALTTCGMGGRAHTRGRTSCRRLRLINPSNFHNWRSTRNTTEYHTTEPEAEEKDPEEESFV
jgi:hypothetical protein